MRGKGKEPDKADRASEDLLSSYQILGTDASELNDVLDLTPEGEWVKKTGRTPLEFLTEVYRHPLVAMKDRISAAGRVLDFVHRKLPERIEMTGADGKPLAVEAAALSRLSSKELDALEKLLQKAAG